MKIKKKNKTITTAKIEGSEASIVKLLIDAIYGAEQAIKLPSNTPVMNSAYKERAHKYDKILGIINKPS